VARLTTEREPDDDREHQRADSPRRPPPAERAQLSAGTYACNAVHRDNRERRAAAARSLS
jgi:hypothetical protein